MLQLIKLILQDDCIATMNATTNALVADGYVVNYNDTTLDTTTYSATQHYDFNLTSGGFLIDILNETLESIYDSNGLLINQTINIFEDESFPAFDIEMTFDDYVTMTIVGTSLYLPDAPQSLTVTPGVENNP